MSVHATAVVAPEAELDSSVEVGPFTIIGPKVRIGAGTRIGPHVVIEGRTTIGKSNRIFQFAAVGAIPQDLKYAGEDSSLCIGDENQIREFATLHLGTTGGGGVTRVGDQNLFMAYSHVAHDCQVASHCVVANCGTLGGHVSLEDHVHVGGLAGVHQFARVGMLSFIAAGAMVTQDVPPYCTVHGNRAKLAGLNTVGLTRGGYSAEQISRIKSAYRSLFRSKLGRREAIAHVRAEHGAHAEIERLLRFVEGSERGIAR